MSDLIESDLANRCRDLITVGRTIRVLDATASTNDVCHAAAESGSMGLAVFADYQSSGRGRHGHQWTAPKGTSLLFSVLLDPPEPLNRAEFLTAWTAVAVAEVVRTLCQLDCRIKWPNDLLIDGRKTAGILVERRRATVVGIGLNVSIQSHDFPEDLRASATSLLIESGIRFDRTELASAILHRLDELYQKAVNGGIENVWKRWQQYAEDYSSAPVVAVTRYTLVAGNVLELCPSTGARIQREDGMVVRIPPDELVRIERPAPNP